MPAALAALAALAVLEVRLPASPETLLWRGVEKLTGTVTIEYGEWIREPDGSPPTTLQSRELVDLRFTLQADRSHGSSGMIWRAVETAVTGSIRLESEVRTGDGGRTTHTADYSGPVKRPENFKLSMDPETGEWQLITPGFLTTKYAFVVKYIDKDPRTDTEQRDKIQSAFFQGTATGRPAVIVATIDEADKVGGRDTRGYYKKARLMLRPEVDDVRVEVTIAGYGTWLPRGNVAAPALPGSQVKARAVLIPRPGRPAAASPRARSFRFELARVSREPGIAMNWPKLSPDGDVAPPDDPQPDLRFAADGFAQLTNENLAAAVAPRRDEQDRDLAELQVASFDFGGTAELRVICVLEDGRELVGQLDHEGRSLTDIPLPFRRSGSLIAEAWRKRYQLDGDDKEDRDEQPVGAGQKGDGFSNYEEYRGFVENRGHLRTPPGQKDLFIENGLGRHALPGLFLFTDLTRLRVHYELRPDSGELPPSRRMNLNRSAQSPRSSEEYQHGLILTTIATGNASEAVIDVGLWRPKNTEEVRILSLLFAPDRTDELAATIAHELLHSIGTHHHGETDPGMVVWMRKETMANGVRDAWFEERPARWSDAHNGYIFSSAPGARIRILRADEQEVSPDTPGFLARPEQVYVAIHGGQHSGMMECVMRYNCAFSYVLPDRPRDRFYATLEPPRTALCESAVGTLLSQPGLRIVRYGDASAGDCRHQFCVRDDAPDPEKRAKSDAATTP